MTAINRIVPWQRLTTWTLRHDSPTSWPWPGKDLDDVLDPVKPEAMSPAPGDVVRLAGVRWYGNGLFVREERNGAQLKGKCYPLKAGRLVYNRLFAWKMAFAAVSEEFSNVAVSNEFPQFAVDPEQAAVDFIALVCTSEMFSAAVLERSTGTTAVSRNRLREADLLRMRFPCPPVSTQDALVSSYRAALEEADRLENQAEDIRAAAWREFESALGIASRTPGEDVPLTSIARFADLARWDVRPSKVHDSLRWPVEPLVKHAGVRLGCQIPRRSDSRPGPDRPYLRAANVRRGIVDLEDVKTMRVSSTLASALVLEEDDLLFVEGSGSIDEVGRCAVWPGDSNQDFIHQNSVIRARCDESLLPRFAAAWFNCEGGRSYFRDVATTTSGLYHVGAGKVERAGVPILPKPLQAKLADRLLDALEDSRSCEEDAERLRVSARSDFDVAVFGPAS